jgi:DNA 3'-phosphatase
MKKYKVLFADLDGTLIKTKSGKTFPEDLWDMKLKYDVLDAIRKLRPDYVIVVTNQGGIEKGFITKSDFMEKLRFVTEAIRSYSKVLCAGTFCESNDPNCDRRKPNTGMLEQWKSINAAFSKSNMLMIGDASGKEGQFSDSDKKTAENFGIDYMDVDDFVKALTSTT